MKTQHERLVVAVDDDEINLMILVKSVLDAGYAVKSFASGESAWEYVQRNPDTVDVVLLDKMMPGMGGMQLLRNLKSSASLRHIPVILQTGDVGIAQMREGLDMGAYYYLSKPFHPEILTSILHSAMAECRTRDELLSQMSAQQVRLLGLIEECEMSVVTHAEAQLVAAAVAQAAVYPEFIAIGLMELLSNAIEHGNLEIGYEQKRKALVAGSWPQLLTERMRNPEFSGRAVRLQMQKIPSGLHITIVDEGRGFDWKRYLHDEQSPLSLHEPNGRGIAKALVMLDDIRYMGRGNEVRCNVTIPAYLPAGSDFALSVKPS